MRLKNPKRASGRSATTLENWDILYEIQSLQDWNRLLDLSLISWLSSGPDTNFGPVCQFRVPGNIIHLSSERLNHNQIWSFLTVFGI